MDFIDGTIGQTKCDKVKVNTPPPSIVCGCMIRDKKNRYVVSEKDCDGRALNMKSAVKKKRHVKWCLIHYSQLATWRMMVTMENVSIDCIAPAVDGVMMKLHLHLLLHCTVDHLKDGHSVGGSYFGHVDLLWTMDDAGACDQWYDRIDVDNLLLYLSTWLSHHPYSKSQSVCHEEMCDDVMKMMWSVITDHSLLTSLGPWLVELFLSVTTSTNSADFEITSLNLSCKKETIEPFIRAFFNASRRLRAFSRRIWFL